MGKTLLIICVIGLAALAAVTIYGLIRSGAIPPVDLP